MARSASSAPASRSRPAASTSSSYEPRQSRATEENHVARFQISRVAGFVAGWSASLLTTLAERGSARNMPRGSGAPHVDGRGAPGARRGGGAQLRARPLRGGAGDLPGSLHPERRAARIPAQHWPLPAEAEAVPARDRKLQGLLEARSPPQRRRTQRGAGLHRGHGRPDQGRRQGWKRRHSGDRRGAREARVASNDLAARGDDGPSRRSPRQCSYPRRRRHAPATASQPAAGPCLGAAEPGEPIQSLRAATAASSGQPTYGQQPPPSRPTPSPNPAVAVQRGTGPACRRRWPAPAPAPAPPQLVTPPSRGDRRRGRTPAHCASPGSSRWSRPVRPPPADSSRC